MECNFFKCNKCCKNKQTSSYNIVQRGQQGPQGPQGIQGERGEQGLIGPTGPQVEPGVMGPTGPQGEIGLQGIQGEKGEKGDKGDSGSLVVPSYGNFINPYQQTIQFDTMQRGFITFNSAQSAQGVELANETDIVVKDAGVYKIDLSMSVNNYYNSINLTLFVNDSPVSTLLASVTNGSFSTTRIISLEQNDVIKVGATVMRLVLNGGLSLSIFKLDE